MTSNKITRWMRLSRNFTFAFGHFQYCNVCLTCQGEGLTNIIISLFLHLQNLPQKRCANFNNLLVKYMSHQQKIWRYKIRNPHSPQDSSSSQNKLLQSLHFQFSWNQFISVCNHSRVKWELSRYSARKRLNKRAEQIYFILFQHLGFSGSLTPQRST